MEGAPEKETRVHAHKLVRVDSSNNQKGFEFVSVDGEVTIRKLSSSPFSAVKLSLADLEAAVAELKR